MSRTEYLQRILDSPCLPLLQQLEALARQHTIRVVNWHHWPKARTLGVCHHPALGYQLCAQIAPTYGAVRSAPWEWPCVYPLTIVGAAVHAVPVPILDADAVGWAAYEHSQKYGQHNGVEWALFSVSRLHKLMHGPYAQWRRRQAQRWRLCYLHLALECDAPILEAYWQGQPCLAYREVERLLRAGYAWDRSLGHMCRDGEASVDLCKDDKI